MDIPKRLRALRTSVLIAIPAHVLGKKLQITSATMTGILDRLEKMGLVERRPHPDDRRAILVCLTDQGIGDVMLRV